MIIGGTNVADFGLIVESRETSRQAAAVISAIAGAPGAFRRVRIGQDAPEPLLITLTGHLIGTSLADLQTNLDELKYRTRPNTDLTIAWSDQTTREYIGRRESLEPTDIPPGWVNPVVKVRLTILCPDPRARYSSAESESTSGAVPLILTPAIGTAPMPVIITLKGNNASNLVNPTIQYRDSSDNVVKTFTHTATMDGGDTLVIDTENFTVELNDANDIDNFDGDFFDMDPNDGDYLNQPSGRPDVRLSGTGTADQFKLDFRRRYW
jgi:hypothetical protein